MITLDQSILTSIQTLASPWLTLVMQAVSVICTPEVIVPVMALWLGWLFFRHQRLQEAILILILAGNLMTLAVKPMVQRQRPSPTQAVVLDRQGDFSFPSGHTLAAMTVGGAVILLARQTGHRQSRLVTGLVIGGIFLVGFSRVYLGAHWPSDVLAGYVIGWLWLIIVWKIVRPLMIGRASDAAAKTKNPPDGGRGLVE